MEGFGDSVIPIVATNRLAPAGSGNSNPLLRIRQIVPYNVRTLAFVLIADKFLAFSI